MTTCNKCKGSGKMPSDQLPYLERLKPQPAMVTCTMCDGTGKHLWTDNVRIPKKFIFQLRAHFNKQEYLTNKEAYVLYDMVVDVPEATKRREANRLAHHLPYDREFRYMNVRNYLCKLTNEGSLERVRPGVYRIEIEDYENWFPDDEHGLVLPNYAKSNLDHAELEWQRDQSRNLL